MTDRTARRAALRRLEDALIDIGTLLDAVRNGWCETQFSRVLTLTQRASGAVRSAEEMLKRGRYRQIRRRAQ